MVSLTFLFGAMTKIRKDAGYVVYVLVRAHHTHYVRCMINFGICR